MSTVTFPNAVIEQIYKTRTTLTLDGASIPLGSEISEDEGRFIFSRIQQRPDIIKTLEVGCAQALSTLHILEGLKGRTGAHHTVIDPFQRTDWRGAGLAAIQRAGFSDMVTLVEQVSEVALPALLAEHEGTFDMVFIDGWHTFDHTLLDSFYGLRLLKTGGLLIIDDCDMAGIAKVARYLGSYPCLRIAAKTMDYPKDAVLRGLCRFGRFIPLPMNWRSSAAQNAEDRSPPEHDMF